MKNISGDKRGSCPQVSMECKKIIRYDEIQTQRAVISSLFLQIVMVSKLAKNEAQGKGVIRCQYCGAEVFL